MTPHDFILMTLTEQGIMDKKNAPALIEEAVKSFAAAGGKLLDFYTGMGFSKGGRIGMGVIIIGVPDSAAYHPRHTILA